MGASVAWHLRELGVSDVVLLERDSLAAGSTSRSAGGIRTQFSDELNIRIALRSLEEFERMDGIELRQYGYLFLLDRPEDVAVFQDALALQHRLGVPSRELSIDEALRLVPQLDPKGLLSATYCELDGHASPESQRRRVISRAARSSAAPASGRTRSRQWPASTCRSRASSGTCGSAPR